MNQYARSAATPRSQTRPISLKSTQSAFKSVDLTAKREWKNQSSGTPGLVRQEMPVSRERERTGSTIQNRQDTGRTGEGTFSGYDAEAERIWRDTETEKDNNKSIITRAASLERMETGSIIGSEFNNSKRARDLNFVGKKKCIESEHSL